MSSSEWEKKSQATKARENRYYDSENTDRNKKTLKQLAKSTLTTIEKAAKRIGDTEI